MPQDQLLYIGLRRNTPSDSWTWPDGSESTWTKWNGGFPQNNLCTGVRSDNGLWQDDRCSTPRPFICTTQAAGNTYIVYSQFIVYMLCVNMQFTVNNAEIWLDLMIKSIDHQVDER